MELNTPVILALQARLSQRFAAVLADIRTNDGVALPVSDPVQVFDYVPHPAEIDSGNWPCVGIGDLPTRLTDDIGSSATGEHGLAIVAFYAAADQRELAWALRRYARAMTTIALETRALLPAWLVTLKSIVPGPTVGAEEKPRGWESFISVHIEAHTDEQ